VPAGYGLPLNSRTYGLHWSALLTAIALLAGCGQEPAPSGGGEMQPPEVTVAPPALEEITEWDEYTGRFQAIESVEVRARVSGYLESIHFTDGDMVEKGDLLFVIDPRPFEAALAAAEARRAEAEARLEVAERDLERASDLLKDGNISKQVYDQRRAERDAAAATLAGSQADVRSARLDLDFTRVEAPVSGLISREFVTVGNLVSGGTADSTLLTRINSIDPIYLFFDADEAAYLKYIRLDRAGLRPSSRGAANRVRVSLVDEEGFPHAGRMDFVDNQIDPATGTMRGRAILPNPEQLMMPGMFARVRLAGRGPYEALLVPDSAIATDQARRVLFVVDEENIARARPVETGPKALGLRVIRSGVEPDDRVVINGLQRVRPGVEVAPQQGEIVPRRDGGPNEASSR